MLSASLSSFTAQRQASESGEGNALARTLASAKNTRMSQPQIERTAKDFESMFVAQMLEQMFGDSVGSELFGDEETSDIYKGLMMEQYGKEIARAGGIGIADYVRRELLRLQEV